jgi:hypothetical protein
MTNFTFKTQLDLEMGLRLGAMNDHIAFEKTLGLCLPTQSVSTYKRFSYYTQYRQFIALDPYPEKWMSLSSNVLINIQPPTPRTDKTDGFIEIRKASLEEQLNDLMELLHKVHNVGAENIIIHTLNGL